MKYYWRERHAPIRAVYKRPTPKEPKMSKARCPQCQEKVEHIKVEPMPLYDNAKVRWKGIALLCPDCHTILSVGIDPEEILSKEERKALREHGQIKTHL
jgi:hypothetical protein